MALRIRTLTEFFSTRSIENGLGFELKGGVHPKLVEFGI